VKTRKYVEIFAREAEEHLQILRQGLLALEQEGLSAERVHALLRSAHTLKGSARMLDLGQLGEVAHGMEDLFKELEGGSRPLAPALIDLLLVATDAVEALVAQAHSGGEIAVNVDAVLEGLRTGLLPEIAASAAPAAIIPEKIERETVRASVARLDQLVNLLGEMLIARRMLEARQRQMAGLRGRLEGFLRRLRRVENYRLAKELLDEFSRLTLDLERDTQNLGYLADELHDRALELRMLPLGTITEDLVRMARDLARDQGKEVHFGLRGEEVELDRLMLEAVRPMLLHMLRNAVDHGLEEPAERQRAGKPAAGRIELTARYEGGGVRLSLSDDGRGIDPERVRQVAAERGLLTQEEARGLADEEAVYLILRPGFSTREFITDVSGRGVGMDVVKANIDRVKGNLIIHSRPGQGTEMLLQLPLTLAVVNGLLLDCEGETYAVPLHYVAEILRLRETDILSEGGREVVRVRGTTLPLFSLQEILGLPRQARIGSAGGITALVLSFREQQLACLVSRSREVQELVVKGMGRQLRSVPFFTGATILADGAPALILSVPDLFDASLAAGGTQLRREFAATAAKARKGRVLVVDDSITTRTMEKNILETHGYEVTVAISGPDALVKLAAADYAFDLVVSDVEMPGMTGFELTRKLREMERTRQLPVIIVTSLASDADRRQGIEAGAQAYIVKGSFDQGTLLQTVETLIG
jgi:two-component system chemotaxis sensor kinase CheA